MELTGQGVVACRREGGPGEPFRAVDPAADAEVEPAFGSAGLGQVDEAAAAAAAAFPLYRALPASQRTRFLHAAAAGLETHRKILVARAHRETALPAARLEGELARTCRQLRLYADTAAEGWWLDARIDRGDPARRPTPNPDVRSMLFPLGPVVVFGSSNFPFAYSVAGGDTASALAAGCPVIVKAHPAHPGASELAGVVIADAAARTGMPPGVFSLLFDAGFAVGQALVRHPQVKAVGFTGSLAGGRSLMDLAAARPEPIPVYAEMGSVNPVFVLPHALAEGGRAIAAGLHESITLGVGQFCTNPGLVLLPDAPEAGAFLADLGRRMAATVPAPMLTRGICARHREGVERMARTPGVEVAGRARPTQTNDGAAALLTTTAAVFLAQPHLAEEVFGPSTLAVVCADAAEMRAVARSLGGQLTASIHGSPEDCAAAAELIALLQERAGRIIFNGFPTGLEVVHAIVHGGPYPATSDGRSTSVGTRALARWTRPLCYQNAPDELLPPELRNGNPLAIRRLEDGRFV